jgi:hypothetical protein
MRCEEIIQELSAPSDNRDSTALAEHLAGCRSCAEWAERAALLDRVWQVTRPAEPEPHVWDSIWASLAPLLDQSTLEAVRSSVPDADSPVESCRAARFDAPERRPSTGSRPWKLGAAVLVGLAQAAAVLLAIGLAWQPHTSRQITQTAEITGQPAPTVAIHFAGPIEIEEGRVVLIEAREQASRMILPLCLSNLTLVPISVEGPALRVVDQTPAGVFFGVDDWYVMFNAVEGIANPVVAMKE